VVSVAVYDGKIISESKDYTIRVWNMAIIKQIGNPLQGHIGSVYSVVVHSGKIVSESEDNTIRL
jgi:WD40 repeat protein